jgi:hypothetical protein
MDHLKYPKLLSKYGCWIVNGRGFLRKFEAFKYASILKTDEIFFYYHNHIWENFDRSLLGKIPLPDLYKQRAQQLRDRYSHLVLHFSGGSDSYNILHTFLKHKIKLDEIVVKWPKILSDKKFYTPNANDTSARNALSEWDYAIEPVLKRISNSNPEIKITIVDYAENLMSKKIIGTMNKKLDHNNYFYSNYTPAVFFMSANIDKFDARYKPENTAHIFGIEKPVLSENSDGIYFHFLDHAMDMLIVNPELGTKEPFYWTADFPILPMEQAYQTALNVAIDKKFKNCLINKDDQNSALRVNRLLKLQNKLFKDILYRDSWNPSTFQVGKPNVDRSDWYYWMYEMSDFAEARDVYSSTVKSIQSDIDTSLLLEKTNYNAGLRKLKTKGFKILDFVQ